MNPHSFYPLFALFALVSWSVAIVGFIPSVAARRKTLGTVALLLGLAAFAVFAAWLWVSAGRPPMRTQWETRLWFVVLLASAALLLQWRWRSALQVIPSTILAMVFTLINLFKPEQLDKTQMPALNSPWFIPHVMVYILSYALFGMAALVAAWGLLRNLIGDKPIEAQLVAESRRLVYIGFPLLTVGLLLGAVWAKIAWGTYWGWDPKETGAFVTWAVYLTYLHLEHFAKLTPRTHLALLAVGFLVVLGTWFGINYLPSASSSIHTYSN
jgi:ABC-type transport system involved in cytochrome c biogenesis permease subunit